MRKLTEQDKKNLKRLLGSVRVVLWEDATSWCEKWYWPDGKPFENVVLATVGFLCPDGDHKKYASVAGLSALERGGSYKYVHQVPREAKPRVLTLRKVFDMLEME